MFSPHMRFDLWPQFITGERQRACAHDYDIIPIIFTHTHKPRIYRIYFQSCIFHFPKMTTAISQTAALVNM